MIPLSYFLILAAVVFALGLGGFLTRRNLIQALMCLELMANSVNLVFIALTHQFAKTALEGMIFALFVMVVAAAEIGIGLAFIILFFRRRGRVALDDLNLLGG